ncbi:transcription termination/antitermination protein NusA [Mycoplasma sp. Pen4]|uniref:NusA N-terminal domain-containing protein n=1 Tax=Mycoplasma sp. Pen4 TaxID=640330 RepID=UPI00165437EA|nr:NusA N-terminal domain-containing protein [Mycoplasma sp. Pen4]QNM93504.1 transcription termination/antitermination protein NusA [Mycoplasma sp. Pen4]
MAKKQAQVITLEQQWYTLIENVAVNEKTDFDAILNIFKEEIERAITRDIDKDALIELKADHDNHIIRMFNLNGEVVADDFEFTDDSEKLIFITMSDAKILNDQVEEGDQTVIEFSLELLPKKIKTAIFNGYKQAIKALEKQKIIDKYTNLIGSKLNAKILTRNKNGSYNVALEDQVTAYLPVNKINANIELQPGKFLTVYLDNIDLESKLSILQVATNSPTEIADLLTKEIPEIANGDIEIVAIQRSAGIRSKIAIKQVSNFDIDLIGSILGESGSRISAVSAMLGGEKLDIIRYSDDITEYIKNALAPARVIDVVADSNDPENRRYNAIVTDRELMVAIGKKGINIELAAKLTGTKIQVMSANEALDKNITFKNEVEFDDRHYFRSTSKSSKHKSSKSSAALKDLDLYFDNDELFASIDFSEIAADIQEESNADKPKTKSTKSTAAKAKTVNMSEVDSLFEQEINEANNFIESINEYDFIDEIDKYEDENDNDLDSQTSEEDVVTKQKAKTKKVIKEFINSKEQLKDFKVDDDLAHYGLGDSDIDVSDFEDGWE